MNWRPDIQILSLSDRQPLPEREFVARLPGLRRGAPPTIAHRSCTAAAGGVRTTRHKGLAIPDHLLNTLTLLARLPVSKPVIGSFFLLAWKAVSTNPDIKTSPLLKVRGPERQKSA